MQRTPRVVEETLMALVESGLARLTAPWPTWSSCRGPLLLADACPTMPWPLPWLAAADIQGLFFLAREEEELPAVWGSSALIASSPQPALSSRFLLLLFGFGTLQRFLQGSWGQERGAGFLQGLSSLGLLPPSSPGNNLYFAFPMFKVAD